jgi:integrase
MTALPGHHGVDAADLGRPDPLIVAIDIDLLIRLGWDPATGVFSPDPAHPLLGYKVCRVVGCDGEAGDKRGICTGCLFRWKTTPDVDLDTFCAAGVRRRHRTQPDLCAVCCVPGFERPATANGLCFACDGQRRKRGQTTTAYRFGDEVFSPATSRPGLGSCPVWACGRVAARPSTRLCGAHDAAWRHAKRPELVAFYRSAPPCVGDRSGQVVLAGLPERVISELLYSIQTSVGEGRQLKIQVLRPTVTLLRRGEVDSVAAIDTAGGRDPMRWFLRFAANRAALARACPETEQAKDIWDLRVWGAGGQLSFVGGGVCRRSGTDPTRPITQPWLRQAAKAWAAEALIRMTTGPVRAVIGAVGLWSEHLARRPDSGADPAVLTHRDIESFLARLGPLKQPGTLSAASRDRTIHQVAKFLRDCREMGLARPGRELAALAGDVVIRAAERPAGTRADDEVGKALPDAVLAQLLVPDSLALLEELAGPTLRAAVELGVGVGRRTAELCSLAFDCVDYDQHPDPGGARRRPVLVHDMPKVDKFGCRLPIHDREVAIISAQQARVRAAFPATPTDRLALFPRPLKNPDGTHPLGTAHLQRAMHQWVEALPRLDAPERDAAGQPIAFPRDTITPYAFRHSFAQRHADAGTPLDALKELLGHDTVRTTLGYYRVTSKRKREAQDRLGPLQVDRAGRLVRPGINGLAEAERLGDDIGQVAVPFGICTEPVNVAAGGHSCPFRHRCSGCEYFRTDPSFQPELSAYLAQLLADRERLATAVPQLAEWARRDAAPSVEEIDAVRRLVRANDEALAALDQDDRDAIEDAITTIRKHRATLNVTFPVELRGVIRQPTPRLFPTIEVDARPTGTHG